MMMLNFQFWEGDKKQAMQLARFIADIEPAFRDDVVALFTARFDCKHDEDTIAYVSKKFRTFKCTTTRRATGWPDGPNQMFGESYQWIVENARNQKIPSPKCILFIEADCIPMRADWINVLYKEWQESGKDVSGAWLKRADAGIEHINGNCIIAFDFWKKFKPIFHPPSLGGWDALLAHGILPYGHPSKYIWSDYQLGHPHNPWRGCDFLWAAKRYTARDNPYYGMDLYPAYFHGIKTDKGLQCARERILGKVEEKVLT